MEVRRLIIGLLSICLFALASAVPALANYIDPVSSPKLTGQRGSGANQVAGLSNGTIAMLVNANTNSPSVKVVTSDGTLVYNTSLAAALGARANNKSTMAIYPVANGELIVTVEGTSNGCDNNTNNPYMFLRLSATGVITTPFTAINTSTNAYNCYTDMAELSNGNLAFTFQTAGDSYSLRILQPNGTPVTGQTSIQKTGTGQGNCNNSSAYSSNIASNQAGQFLITEHCYNNANLYGVLYSDNGTQITVGGVQHFALGTYSNSPYTNVMGLSDGNFMVAFSGNSGASYQLKKVQSDGTTSSAGSFTGVWPSFKSLGDGGFMIFDSLVNTVSGYDYYYTTGARYSNSGTLLEAATKLDNSYSDRCWPDPDWGSYCDSYDDTSYFGAPLAVGHAKGVLFPNGRTGDLWLHSFVDSAVAPSISAQPANASVTLGGTASFSATATGSSITYQWQVDTGSGFSNLSDGSVYSGSTTSTLGIAGATLAMNGYAYRVVITGSVNPAATSNSATLTVSKKTSSTSLATSGSPVSQGTSVTLTATVTGSGTPTGSVTFLDGATQLGTAALNGSGSASYSSSALSVGSHTLTAQYGGDASFNGSTSAPLTQTIYTVPGAPTIGSATAGDAQASVSFAAPGSNGGSPITGYTVTASPGGATATGASSPITVTGLTNGTSYSFTVSASNTAGTGSASAPSNSVTPKAVQSITFTNPGAQNFGTTPTLSAVASSGLTVSFSSSTTGVCTVTAGGALSFLAAGTCSIAADQAGNGSYLAASTVTRSFAVNAVVPGAPTIGSATAGEAQASVSFTAPASTGGTSITGYTVTASPGGATATGASSPLTVTGLTNGTSYSFTVSATNTAGTGSASAPSNSVTPKAAQTITFANPGAQSFGSTPTLNASTSSGLTPSFSSATAGICAVTADGQLSFSATGTCTIRADQAGNGSYGPAPQVSQSFAVNKGSQSLSFSQPPATSYGAQALDLSGFVTAGASTSPVIFSIVGGTGSGTLSGSNGKLLSAGSAGSIVIQADQAADAGYNAAAPVQRTVTVNKATLTVIANSQTKVYGAADPTLSYIFSGLANGDSAGVISGALTRAAGESVAGGPYAIGQGTLAAGNNYQISFTGANLTITRATPALSWLPPYPVPSGTSLDTRQLNATASLPGSFAYTPGTGALVSQTQALSVTFTPTDTGNYTSATATVLLEVDKIGQSIAFAPLALKILTDAPFNLSASADSGLPVSYASSNPAVATVSGSTVTIVGVGTATITASQPGNATYGAAASVNQPLVVGYTSSAPALTVSTLEDGTVTQLATINLTGTVTSLNGIASLVLNGQPVQVTGGGFSVARTMVEGRNTFVITAVDNAGLETTDSRSITLDTTAPAIGVDTPADNSVVSSRTLTCTGQMDNIGTVSATVNGGAPQQAAMTGSAFEISLNLADGTNTVFLTATDLAGNSSTVKRTVVSDTTTPALAVTSPAADATVNATSVTIVGTVSDDLGQPQVVVTLDGQNYTPQVTGGSFTQQLSLPSAKSYAITVRATDQAGNVSTVQRNVLRPKMLGDLTRDGRVDIADALKALQIAVGFATADADDLAVGDVGPLVGNVPQPDGVIDIEDALAILKKAVGSLNF
ncbi:hypothetical protein GMLC_36450 [Geomonas limicola]|uniref:Fibronectin type-III domain-containing protein n=1 Tax=Geomonas limicola TaxID=2740186 RepID=A0A6V8NC21_9BACT|nr:Ig-like domain repeat protein [Geomonas limicola]GFO70066.1 hypothetical protein GMLC_36450 [Geomonas limicola]